MKSNLLVLGIETSCDDTSVALVYGSGRVLGSMSANQDQQHAKFGGIVPEIASRNHGFHLLPMVESLLEKYQVSWEQIDLIAVTSEPGLIGSLLVGVVTAKSLAMAKGKALIGVNHLEGHILAPFLQDESYTPHFEVSRPCISLAVSGGHTSLYFVNGFGNYQQLGTTIDDAAGEAFDKFAKSLGLGYPGGQKVDSLACSGDVDKYKFPIALKSKNTLNFSFSGLKTAGLLKIRELDGALLENETANLCASYQEAIVDALLGKSKLALMSFKKKFSNLGFCITGGVSANTRLRDKANQLAKELDIICQIPPIRYCTDNAAMIAYAGALAFRSGRSSDMHLVASARNSILDFS